MPAWTAVVQYILLKEKLSLRVYLTLIPIIGGAMMVCKGEVVFFLLIPTRFEELHLVSQYC